ncbi:MAG: hypothetical protein ACRD50_02600 [Candidatus Acidiferrales bacterium]
MKRLEKQRAKAERRAQKKLAKQNEPEIAGQDMNLPTESEPHSQPSESRPT